MYENEKQFEAYVRRLISQHITAPNPHIYALENKKTVDILICRELPEPALYFLEIKFHKTAHGRMGTGSANGVGFQPEILKKRPAYFESNLRWVLAKEGSLDY